MTRRILPIALIFIVSWGAWAVLAGTMEHRSRTKGVAMRDAVGGLWGSAHLQRAPEVKARWSRVEPTVVTDADGGERIEDRTVNRTAPLALDSQDISVEFDLEHRKKGLLWFSTYTVDFDGTFAVRNHLGRPVTARITLGFPAGDAVYDGVVASVDGREDALFDSVDGALVADLELAAGEVRTLRFAYGSRGQDRWRYSFGPATQTVRGLDLRMATDFAAIDFPERSLSPDEKVWDGDGWRLRWRKETMVSGAGIGMVFPKRINPGPFAAAMSSSAPISLFFFFFVVFFAQSMGDIRLHPMHYFFFAASFFSFNLLFAYSVDHIDIVPAFALAAAVSFLLVVPYSARAMGWRFAVYVIATAQLVYQVIFGVAHFFEGYTGLTVTLGAIATLAAVMQATAKVDWEERFPGPALAAGAAAASTAAAAASARGISAGGTSDGAR